MALSPDLVDFVKEGLGRGLSRSLIEDILIRAGWPKDQVRRALGGFADVESPIPVPRPAISTRPREAFLYVVMFMALFVSAYSLGAVLFALVDLALPDPAGVPPEVIREILRFSVSALVVASPLFWFVTRVVRRGVQAQPSTRASRIRLQLTYLTLFVASCGLVGAVTALIYSFLGGELTARFVLKALTVSAIAGGAFGYYLRDLREVERDPVDEPSPRRRDPLPGLGAAVVAVAVVSGLVALGSPASQRRERLDARRAQDLHVISRAIDRYEATHERLPSTLGELQRGSDIQVVITDPVTREPYGYEASAGTAYELCAVFELATTDERELHRGRPFSRHEAGRHCFQLRAERDRNQ